MQIKPRLQFVLPLAQVVIALLLIPVGARQEWRLQMAYDCAYAAPAWHLCDAITGPLRPLITSYRFVPFGRDPLLHPHSIALTMIALWWFWVAMNITRLNSRRGLALPSPVPLRLLIDALLILNGVWCGYLALFGAAENGLVWFLQQHSWWYSFKMLLERGTDVTASFCYLLWSVVLIVVFGRDILELDLSPNAPSH